MANKMTAHYVAEAQAVTKSKSEKQPIRGGDYAAQGQLDSRVRREIGGQKEPKAGAAVKYEQISGSRR
jgi:hypothetical protein